MIELVSSLYGGKVLHRRYTPVRHELQYAVMNCFIDVDELPHLARKCRLLGYNRRAIFSIQDRHHGPGDGTPIAAHVRQLMSDAQPDAGPLQIYMFCYPAVFGHVFNPMTAYFGFDAGGSLVAVIYEVNNTFGQRHSYVVAVSGQRAHGVAKRFYVSPFNPDNGEYRFELLLSESHLRLNICLFEGSTLKICARFTGERCSLSDAVLLRHALSLVIQPVKIIAGIHWEALKLYLKGLRPKPRPSHARYAVTHTMEDT